MCEELLEVLESFALDLEEYDDTPDDDLLSRDCCFLSGLPFNDFFETGTEEVLLDELSERLRLLLEEELDDLLPYFPLRLMPSSRLRGLS